MNNQKHNIILTIIGLIVLSGCARGINYQALDRYMVNNDCTAGIGYLEEHRKNYGSNKELLYLLDSAMIHMLCGNYEKSNGYFHRAETLTEELWTKSITKESAAFLLNDYTVPYAGEDFEKALINLFSAINYLKLGMFDDSLVEVRRLDAVLTMLNDQYSKKNIYKEDAFGRYLSAIIYEADNNLNDAFIDYYKALNIFQDYKDKYGMPIPSIFVEDLIRVAKATDRTEEIRSFIDKYGGPDRSGNDGPDEMGKIILIHFNGTAPVKRSANIFVPTRDGPVAIAFPLYYIARPLCGESRFTAVSALETISSDTELVEDINQIAVKNLEDRRGRITLKMIARVAAKQIAIHQVENKTARELLNIANLFVERADTRSWRTLPGEIYLGRLFVREGDYDIHVSQCAKAGQFVETVHVSPGATKFVLYESMY